MEVPTSSSWVLPNEFVFMNDILNGEKPQGSFVNVAGLVRDVQLPMKSKGDHFKMRMALVDKSLDSSSSTLSLHIFASLHEMPTASLCDVVVLRNARVQQYNGERSLIVHKTTLMLVYPADTIPPISHKTLPPLRPCGLNKRNFMLARSAVQFEGIDGAYATRLFHAVDKSTFPDVQMFQTKVNQSLGIRNKESSLDKLVPGSTGSPKFYDLYVQIVNMPTRSNVIGDPKVLLWVTDYTENPLFRDRPLPDGLASAGTGATVRGQPGDKLGYMSNYNGKKNNKNKEDSIKWPGPFGRRCMLVSCYEPHASYIREHVRVNDWVRLRNVRVSMGQDEKNLEGFMGDDLERGNPVRVERYDIPDMEPENVNEWQKNALARARQYQQHLQMLQRKSKKRKAVAMGTADAEGGEEGKTAKNAKQRRREMRAREANGGSGGGSGSNQQPNHDAKTKQISINPNVVSEHTDQPVTSLAAALEPVQFKLSDDKLVSLPFVNLNFRAQVRVVDFLPERLQDFAVSRKTSQFDVLDKLGVDAPLDTSNDDDNDDDNDSDDDSDDSYGSDDSDDNDESNAGTLNAFVGESVWEWRFALLLEDASGLPDSTPPRRIWAVVDNNDAQLLLDLNASNLRHDGKALKALKAKMFLLWGELYERKEKAWAAARAAKTAEAERVAAAKKAEENRQAAEAKEAERERERQRQKEEEKRRKEELRQQAASSRTLLHYPGPALNSDDEEAEDEETGEAAPTAKTDAEKPEQPATEEGPDTNSKDAEMTDAPVQPSPAEPIRQRPFVCCLRQYGIQVRTAGAGRKKRTKTWKQMFALHGTQIQGASYG